MSGAAESASPTSAAAAPAATRGPVLIIGTGLLGTSLALVLTAAGVPVQLQDTSPTSLALARDMGAGAVRAEGDEKRQRMARRFFGEHYSPPLGLMA